MHSKVHSCVLASICCLLVGLLRTVEAAPSQSTTPQSASAHSAAVSGRITIVDRDWRFAQARTAFGATAIVGRRYLAGAFNDHIEGIKSSYQVLLLPERRAAPIELVVFRHDGRMYSTYSIPAHQENELFSRHSPAHTHFLKSDSYSTFVEQMQSGELLITLLRYQPPELSSSLHSLLAEGEELLGLYDGGSLPQLLLIRDAERQQLKFYELQHPPRLSLRFELALACSTKGEPRSGRFLGSEEVDLLFECEDGSLLYVDLASQKSQRIPESEGAILENAFVGDFNGDEREEVLTADLRAGRLLIAQVHYDAVQVFERVLPSGLLQSSGVVQTQFELPTRSELTFYDATRHSWEVIRFDASFNPEPHASLRLEPVFEVRDFLQLLTERGTSSIVLLGTDEHYAVSTYGLSTPLPGARVALGFQHFGLSDGRGQYRFSGLASGEYQVQLSAPGYELQTQSQRLTLREGEERVLDFMVKAPAFEARRQARLCVGYNDLFHRWGYHSLGDDLFSRCARDSAMIQMQDSRELYDNSCCPLPSTDILTDERSHTSAACPEGFVATGPVEIGSGFNPTVFAIECTKINLSRYQLGPAQPGRYWGIGESFRAEGTVQRFELLPEAVRYAVGRVSHRRWDNDGCIGSTPGTLLTTVSTKNCKDMRFRELQYRGLPGDPPQGTPVRLFPECASISSAFSPQPHCLTER